MVARSELDLAPCREPLSFLFVTGQAFAHERPHHGAALWAAHALPGDGRARVQDEAFVEAWNDLTRDAHANQRRPPLHDTPYHLRIGGVNVHAAARELQLGHPRWLPIYVYHRHVLRLYALSKGA